MTVGDHCHNRAQGCPGVVTSSHPMARGCAGCHAGQSPQAREEQARQAQRPTVGRVRPVQPAILARPIPVERPRRSETPEHAVLVEVQRALDGVEGLMWWRNSVGLARTANGGRMQFGAGVGSADLMGVFKGRMLAWEVKAIHGRATPAQIAWISRLERHGGFGAIVHSAAEALALVERARC